MPIDNRTDNEHITTVRIENHTGRMIGLKLDGKKQIIKSSVNGFLTYDIKIKGNKQKIEIITD